MLSKTRPRRLAVGYTEAIHADKNVAIFQYAGKPQAGKLGSLVGIEDLQLTDG